MNPIDPPGLVRQVDRQAAIREVKVALAEYERLGRRTIETGISAGKQLIGLKKQVGHGNWLTTLKDLGCSPSTALRLMTVARNESQFANLMNLGQGLRLLGDDSEDQEECQLDDETTFGDRLKKAAGKLRELFGLILKTRKLCPEDKKQVADLLSRLDKAAEFFSDLPIKKPVSKTCGCGEILTVAVDEKDELIPLVANEPAGKRGNFKIIGNRATRVESLQGDYRRHQCSQLPEDFV
jgi:hypothetical protein